MPKWCNPTLRLKCCFALLCASALVVSSAIRNGSHVAASQPSRSTSKKLSATRIIKGDPRIENMTLVLLAKLFHKFDANKDGWLTAAERKKLVDSAAGNLARESSLKYFDNLLVRFDSNRNNKLDRLEANRLQQYVRSVRRQADAVRRRDLINSRKWREQVQKTVGKPPVRPVQRQMSPAKRLAYGAFLKAQAAYFSAEAEYQASKSVHSEWVHSSNQQAGTFKVYGVEIPSPPTPNPAKRNAALDAYQRAKRYYDSISG